MEERITIRGKTYLVPNERVPMLIGWLMVNAIDASQLRPMQESIQSNKELLLEGNKCGSNCRCH